MSTTAIRHALRLTAALTLPLMLAGAPGVDAQPGTHPAVSLLPQRACYPTEQDATFDWRTSLPKPAGSRPAASCTYAVRLAVAADDAWEVFVDGVRLVPVNGSSEDAWAQPARYELVVPGNGSSLVVAVHARDVHRALSGLLADLQVERLSPASALPGWDFPTGPNGGWFAYQSHHCSAPPADWNTTPFLPFNAATEDDWAHATSAAACMGTWNASPSFLASWAAASGGAAPSEWVWEKSCRAGDKGWCKDTWYRIDVLLDACPEEIPEPIPCCTWKIASHGIADGLFDTPPAAGCTSDPGATPPTASCVDHVGCGWNPGLCKYVCGFDFWSWVCE